MISDSCSRTHVFWPFPFSQRVILKLARGRSHLAFPGSLLLPFPPAQPRPGQSSIPAFGIFSWLRQGLGLSQALGQAGCLPDPLPTSFHPLLRNKEQPWCLWGCGDFSAAVPGASGRGHRGALLEAVQKEEAGTGVSSNVLTLSIFLLTCSKQQHRVPGVCWELYVSHRHTLEQNPASALPFAARGRHR